jgi:tRNA nucleotidyltransferase (CCA-adding enzyme)
VPVDARELARLVARYHAVVQRALELRPSTLLDLLQAADALRRPERLDGLIRACAADALSRPGRGSAVFAPGEWLLAALAVVRSVDAGRIAGEIGATHPDLDVLPERIRAARLDALRDWLHEGGPQIGPATSQN